MATSRAFAVILAVLMCWLLPGLDGCGSNGRAYTGWTISARDVSFTALWTDALNRLGIEDSAPVPTEFAVIWEVDGSLHRLVIRAGQSGHVGVVITTARQAGSESVTIAAERHERSAGETDQPAATPSVSEIAASLDSVGFRGLLAATCTTLAEGEGLMFLRAPGDAVPFYGEVQDYARDASALRISGGSVIALDPTSPASAENPAVLFGLWRAWIRGSSAGGNGPALAWCFVR